MAVLVTAAPIRQKEKKRKQRGGSCSSGHAVSETPIRRKTLLGNELKSTDSRKTCLSCPYLRLPHWKAPSTAANNTITTSRARVERKLTGRGVCVFNDHHLLYFDKLHCPPPPPPAIFLQVCLATGKVKVGKIPAETRLFPFLRICAGFKRHIQRICVEYPAAFNATCLCLMRTT